MIYDFSANSIDQAHCRCSFCIMSNQDKFDVLLEGLEAHHTDTSLLKTGDSVELQHRDGALHCSSSAGIIGRVPEGNSGPLLEGDWRGSVRSLKRNAETKSLTQVLVRFLRGAGAHAPPPGVAVWCPDRGRTRSLGIV